MFADVDAGQVEDELIQRRKKEKEHRRLAVQFLSDPLALDELFVVRSSLQCEITLMKTMLKMNGSEVDFNGMHAHMFDGNPVYRLATLAAAPKEGSFFCRHLETCMELLQNDNLWLASAVTRDERMATFILRAVLRAGALLYEIVQTLSGFPYRLWMLLDWTVNREDVAASILRSANENGCLMDPFSACLTQKYNSAESLLSEECLEILRCIGGMAKSNTHSTECLHSRNARRSFSQRQTHRMSVSQLAQSHQGRSAPQWLPRCVHKMKQPEALVE